MVSSGCSSCYAMRQAHRWSGAGQPVIVGGESGPGARPCNIQWIRGIVAQCQAASVPVFVKQVGSFPAMWDVSEPPDMIPRVFRTKDRKGGDISEWPEDLRVREFPR